MLLFRQRIGSSTCCAVFSVTTLSLGALLSSHPRGVASCCASNTPLCRFSPVIDPPPTVHTRSSLVHCYQCGASFSSYRALVMHSVHARRHSQQLMMRCCFGFGAGCWSTIEAAAGVQRCEGSLTTASLRHQPNVTRTGHVGQDTPAKPTEIQILPLRVRMTHFLFLVRIGLSDRVSRATVKTQTSTSMHVREGTQSEQV